MNIKKGIFCYYIYLFIKYSFYLIILFFSSIDPFELTINEKRAELIYVRFDDDEVGHFTRNKPEARRNAASHRADPSWTPICNLELSIVKSKNYQFVVKRRQLPIVECEAMTIHKSQGQTYERCAVDIRTKLDRDLLYVALSRVTSIEGLYLFGNNSVSEDWSEETLEFERRKRLDAPEQREMRRLRDERKMKNLYPILSIDRIRSSMSFIFLNIQHLNLNKVEAIKADFGFQSCDLIFLSECHLNQHARMFNQMEPEYKVKSVTRSRRENGSHGQVLIYIILTLFLKFLFTICNFFSYASFVTLI